MLKANLLLNLNYTGENLAKLNRSLLLIETTLNGDHFKNAVLNFSMPDGKKSFHFKKYICRWIGRKEVQLKEYSNAEVYNKIMKGQSGNGTERFINFKVEMRPGDGGTTLGSTTGDDIVHTYEGDIKVISDARFAAHLAHEYCHAIGFRHSDKKKCDNLRDCYSVPYAIGNMVEIILTGINRDKCAYPEI